MNEQSNKFDNSSEKLELSNLPKHIAIIMDGNGRWAKKRNLPRVAGHKAGAEALRDIIKTCCEIGISYLTLYAFSTENWKRPIDEVKALMELLIIYLKRELNELNKNNIKINVIGDISKLPPNAVCEIEKATKLTENNTGLTVNIALNYGARNEIINAVKILSKKVKDNTINIEDINEYNFSNYLYTKNQPDPDLVIRTSGEIRLSNFLLWQIAYSELFFTDILWPDFTGNHLIEAIKNYQQRIRRFGSI